MIQDDDERPHPPPTHRIGEPLDTLSVAELSDRIALLRSEIERLEAAIHGKRGFRDAADAVFKRS